MRKDIRKLYEEAMYRATYYNWAARKGYAMAGNDPLDGRPKHGTPKHWGESLTFKAEGRAGHKALAKFWLEECRKLRINNVLA